MPTRVTVKGQITLPKKVRDATGIKPGDCVEVRASAAGTITVEKQRDLADYEARLRALAKRRIIRDITTDEIMEMSRGESAVYRRKKK